MAGGGGSLQMFRPSTLVTSVKPSGHQRGRKRSGRWQEKDGSAILPPLIFISALIMQPIHCSHNGPPESMNAVVLIYDAISFQTGGKKQNKEVKNAVPQ